MWPDRVSNPGPLTYKSGALPIALRGPAFHNFTSYTDFKAHDYNITCKNLYIRPQACKNPYTY